MALTFGDFLSIFTTNDASGGRAIKATFDSGIDDAANYLTKNDPAGGRAIKVVNVGAPLGPQFWAEAYTATTQATSSWTPAGAATNINAAIVPKGTGAITASIPDGTAVGGNARGTYAVDLQVTRSAATQVASANYTTILGGRNNTNRSSDSTLVGGNGNTIWNHRFDGHGVIVGGQNNRIGNADGGSDGWNFIGGGINNSALCLDSCVIVGGNSNTVGGFRSSVVGGASNTLNGNTQSCFIGGGESNTMSASVASNQKGMVIVGGFSNNNTSQYGFIGAGQTNSNTSNGLSSIVGGLSNSITNSYAFIGGGQSNTASASHSFVGGGIYNIASGDRSVIVGGGSTSVVGDGNRATGTLSFVGGGIKNTASGTASVVVGGGISTGPNTASGNYSFIGGGSGNTVNNQYGAIAGGQSNTVSTQFSFIGAGNNNNVTNVRSAIVAGQNNGVGSEISFIGAGQNNSVSNHYSGVVAGSGNTIVSQFGFIGAGLQNNVSGYCATIPSGEANTATTSYSTIPGGFYGRTELYGQLAHASGRFGRPGDAQAHELIWRRSVTGTTQTELFLDGASAAAVIPWSDQPNPATVWHGTIDVCALCVVTGDGTTVFGNVAATSYKVTIKRFGYPTYNTVLVGTVQEIGTTNTDASMATSVFTIDNNDTNESLRIRFTPPTTAGSTTVIYTMATFRGLQILY